MNMKRFVAGTAGSVCWPSLHRGWRSSGAVAIRIVPLLLFVAFAAHAQPVPFDLELGYRSLSLSGSSGMYRTQINERSGLIIRSFTLSTSDFEGHTSLVDRFRVDISDLGAGPAGSLRLQADRTGAYRLRFGYRSADSFSELPAFANPLLGQGIVPGQHTYNRNRKMYDIDLELLPFKAFTPFVGYSANENSGPGQTTYHVGQDEFRLLQDVHDRDREFRVGTAFQFAAVSGQITQGWRSFRGSESLALVPGAGNGNEPGTVIGQPVTATTITRTDRSHVDTPFTNAYVTGNVWKRVRLVGNYVRFAADSNGSESESAAGSFASFALSRFFTGLTETATSSAKNTTWRGGGRAEVTLAPNIDAVAGFQREHRELNGAALIDTVFLQTITFAGFDRTDIETVLKAASSVDRDEKVWNAGVSARALGPFAVRAEVRQSTQDVTVSPDLSEIVVPGSQGGDFSRRVHTFDLGGSFNRAGFTLGAAWRRDRANEPIFRTDYLDRDRYRIRAGWATPKKMFRAGLTAERTAQSNDRSDTGFDARLRQYTAEAEVAPLEALHFRGSVSQFRADSTITFRHPENFNVDTSIHKEDGKSREGGVSYLRGPFSIDASMARFENSGTSPFTIDRNRLRLTWDFKPMIGMAAEWDRDKYDEPSPSYGDFEANRYGLYLRWHP